MQTFRVESRAAAAIKFDPGNTQTGAQSQEPADTHQLPNGVSDKGALYEKVARELTSGRAIVDAMAARANPRPELGVGYRAPAPGLESEIAAIWRTVLNLDDIGADDKFNDLGGKSLDLVRVHGCLARRLGIETDLVNLFQHGTIALLAAHLSGGDANENGLENRVAKMRGARRRAVSRQQNLMEARR